MFLFFAAPSFFRRRWTCLAPPPLPRATQATARLIRLVTLEIASLVNLKKASLVTLLILIWILGLRFRSESDLNKIRLILIEPNFDLDCRSSGFRV